jgi:predicted dehydrogenase
MNISLIGYGYWGPNLARNISQNINLNFIKVCDIRPERLFLARQTYPNIELSENYDDIISDNKTDAVVIATPTSEHFSMVKKALEKGKHVLIEKPMVTDYQQSQYLINLALSKKLVLMADYIFLYNGVVRKIKELMLKKEFGDILYIDSTRINLGLFKNDVNVLWDLAVHDISIINYLIKDRPISVVSSGKCHTKNGIENITYITLNYSSDLIVHIHSSWTSPVKVRQMLLGGNKKMLIYNDIEPTEKLKIYDSGYEIRSDDDKQKMLVDYRIGDVFVPKYDTTEPLSLMIQDFYDAVITEKEAVANFKEILDTTRILSCADESLKNKSKEIFIEW